MRNKTTKHENRICNLCGETENEKSDQARNTGALTAEKQRTRRRMSAKQGARVSTFAWSENNEALTRKVEHRINRRGCREGF